MKNLKIRTIILWLMSAMFLFSSVSLASKGDLGGFFIDLALAFVFAFLGWMKNLKIHTIILWLVSVMFASTAASFALDGDLGGFFVGLVIAVLFAFLGWMTCKKTLGAKKPTIVTPISNTLPDT